MRDGSKNGRARLTWLRARILREYYELHKRPKGAPMHHSWVTIAEIAGRIKMAPSVVRSMLTYKSWISGGCDE